MSTCNFNSLMMASLGVFYFFQKCLSVEDDQTVATHAPKESHTFKNCTHGLGKTTHKFKFSRIFDSTTTQKDFFQETMLDLVKDFIDGQNCLVFTYGVTSSGKTYTIQGTIVFYIQSIMLRFSMFKFVFEVRIGNLSFVNVLVFLPIEQNPLFVDVHTHIVENKRVTYH